MKRREFISLIGGVAATWPLAVQAQLAEKTYTVGILSSGDVTPPLNMAFVDALRELGWIEGKNVVDRKSVV